MWAGLDKLFSGLGGDGELGAALKNLQSQWEGLSGVWNELSKEGGILSRLWDWLDKTWKKIREFLGIPEDQTFLEWLLVKLEQFIEVVARVAGNIAKYGVKFLGFLWDLVGVPALSIWQSMSLIADSIMKIFGIDIPDEQKTEAVRTALEKLLDMIGKKLTGGLHEKLIWLSLGVKAMAEAMNMAGEGVDRWNRLFESLTQLKESIVGESTMEKLKAFGNWFLTEFPKMMAETWESWKAFIKNLLDENDKLHGKITDENEKNSFTNMLKKVQEDTDEKISGNGDATVVSKWNTSTTAIAEGVTTMSESVIEDFDSTSSSMTNMISDFSDVSVPTFVEKTGEMRSAADLLQQSVQRLADSIWDMVNGINAAGNAGVDLSGLDIPGFAAGGQFKAGQPFMAGERGPELIFPKVPGIVVPDLPKMWENMMVGANPTMSAQPVIQNIDKSTHINVNANYANQQSEAGIYYDITAALASIGR